MALRFADAALPLVFALKIQSEQVAGIFQIAEGVHGVVVNHDAGKTGTNAGGLVEQLGPSSGHSAARPFSRFTPSRWPRHWGQSAQVR